MSRAIFLSFFWSLGVLLPITFMSFDLGRRWDFNPRHIFGKVFRRGAGIPQGEFLRSLEDCPTDRVRNLGLSSVTEFKNYFALAQDPRLSPAQLELMIRDLYDESAICVYTGRRHRDVTAGPTINLGGADAVSNQLLYYPKITRRMSPELLDFFIASIAPRARNIAYFSLNDKDFERNLNPFRLDGKPVDGMTRFLLDDKISLSTRHGAFWQFAVEEHDAGMASRPRPNLSNSYLITLLKKVLPSLSYITYDDVYRLAQSDSAQMRDIAKASPLLQEEDKVMIILLDNDPNAEPF